MVDETIESNVFVARWKITGCAVALKVVSAVANPLLIVVQSASTNLPLVWKCESSGDGQYIRPRPARVGSVVRRPITRHVRGDTDPPVPVPTWEMPLTACATFFPVMGSSWSVMVPVADMWVFHMAFRVPERKEFTNVVQAVCTLASVLADELWSVVTHTSPAEPGPVTLWRYTVMCSMIGP